MRSAVTVLLAVATALSSASQQDAIRPVADHHQHFFSPVIAAGRLEPITAKELVPLLDAAGMRRAVVLSQAYAFPNPNRVPQVTDERARVIEENDWTSAVAEGRGAAHPRRDLPSTWGPHRSYGYGAGPSCRLSSLMPAVVP